MKLLTVPAGLGTPAAPRSIVNGKRVALYGILIIAPLVLNGLIWNGLVRPERRTLKKLVTVVKLKELKPRLETLLAQSESVFRRWEVAGLTEAMGEIRQSAKANLVQIKNVDSSISHLMAPAGGAREPDGYARRFIQIPINVDATGSYSRLTRWMDLIEEKTYFTVDSWILKPPAEPGGECSLQAQFILVMRKK